MAVVIVVVVGVSECCVWLCADGEDGCIGGDDVAGQYLSSMTTLFLFTYILRLGIQAATMFVRN